MAFYAAPYSSPDQYACKAADETVTTAVLQDDDELQLPVEAGKVYQVELFVIALGNEDINFGFSVPGTSVLMWSDFGNMVADLSGAGQLQTSAEYYGAAGNITMVNTTATAGICWNHGHLACDTTGTFKVQFCGAVGAASVTMKAGSYLILRKLN